MPTINTIRQRLAAFDLREEERQSLEKTKPEIVSKNRERMLEGLRADGSSMPFYSKTSVEVFGYPPGPIRLKNTGEFQAAIKVEVGFNSIKTSSIDPKTEMLEKKYGTEIFGLDTEGKSEYVADLRPVFIKRVREKLKL